MFEKPFFQKLNKIADWLIRIVVINVIVILFTITVVLFFVGIRVGYALFKDYLNNKETPIFKGAWELLKENFLKNFAYSALFIAILAITGVNIYFYLARLSHEITVLVVVGFVVTLSFFVGFFIVSLYTIPVQLKNPQLKLKLTLKLALYLAGKYFLRSFLILLGFILMPLLIFTVYTSIIYILAGMSFSIIIFALLTRNVVFEIEELKYHLNKKNNIDSIEIKEEEEDV